MSRAIKFRAWDKLRNEWYKASENCGNSPYIGFHVFGECTLLCPPRAEDLQHLVIQQFTGLTDCNGVEIYEGDVVRAFCNINKISDPELNEREPEYDLKLVRYMKGGFVLSTEKYNFCGVLGFNVATMPSDMTVIGNIYEHPHLLNRSSESP